MWVDHGILRTVRVRYDQSAATLGRMLVEIGGTGASVGEISLVRMDVKRVIRDVAVVARDREHMERVVEAVRAVPEVELLEVRDEVLEMHQGGKIAVRSRYALDSITALRRLYTPGVAEVCRLIQRKPEQARRYTAIGHLVAIVTDGTAVLGLGDIGPLAGMPVMEGKAALMESLVGLSGVPILVGTHDPREIIDTVRHIAPTFAAIQLEDISAPRCFEIEAELIRILDKPVMHDDQHGTGVVVTAALMNALEAIGRPLAGTRIGQVGLGAAGSAIARILIHQTGEAVWGADLDPAAVARLESHGGRGASLDEILASCDVVIATTGVPGLIRPDRVRKGQIIFALSNPVPEIDAEEALAAGATFAADGKVVNNVLGFPGILRGAIDADVSRLTVEMYLAAARTIAAAAAPGELVPNPLNRSVHRDVARAVARCALESGLARADLTGYFEDLDAG